MRAVYTVIKEMRELRDEDILYLAFGILCQSGEQEIRIGDISTQEEPIAELVRALNDGQASPLHFGEIVGDFLAN